MNAILIIKSEKCEVVIDNPIFIPEIYSKITTEEIKVARVIDVQHKFTATKQIVTVIIEVFNDIR